MTSKPMRRHPAAYLDRREITDEEEVEIRTQLDQSSEWMEKDLARAASAKDVLPPELYF